jgi:hypothetical protein
MSDAPKPEKDNEAGGRAEPLVRPDFVKGQRVVWTAGEFYPATVVGFDGEYVRIKIDEKRGHRYGSAYVHPRDLRSA